VRVLLDCIKSTLFVGVSAGALALCAHCAGTATARAECALAAVQALPLDDPDQISVGDVRSVVTRLKACEQGPGDAGLVREAPF